MRLRRLIALFATIVGACLLALDLRPLEGPRGEFWMSWSFLHAQGGSGMAGFLPEAEPLTQFVSSASANLVAWLATALAVSIGLGLATAAFFSRRMAHIPSLALRVACVLVWFAALDPALVLWVATRDPVHVTRYVDAGDLFRAVGVGVCAYASALWFAPKADTAFAQFEAPARSAHAGPSLVAALLVAVLLPELLSWTALDRRPLTNDEHAYLYQAELFAHGELAQEVGPLADFFPAPQTHAEGGRMFSVILPGHSAMLAPGVALGLPELVPRLMAALAVLLVWCLGVRLALARPLWGAWCLALSPAFLGVESLSLSHSTALPCALLFVWCTIAALDATANPAQRSAFALAALGGMAISFAFVIRPVTAIAIALPCLVLIARERPRRTIALVATACVAALPAVLWFLWVNHALTGSSFQTVYAMFNRAENAVYGRVSPGPALATASFNLSRLSVWSCGIAPGLLLPVLGYFLMPRGPRTWLLAALSMSLFGFYMLHPFHGIPWVGPVYLTEALPALALLTAQGLFVVRSACGRAVLCSVALASVVGSGMLLSTHFHMAHDEVGLRQQPYRAVQAAGIERGVVFVRMESQRAHRLYPLTPPRPGQALVFARDLGPRDKQLLLALGQPPAWIFDPESGTLTPR